MARPKMSKAIRDRRDALNLHVEVVAKMTQGQVDRNLGDICAKFLLLSKKLVVALDNQYQPPEKKTDDDKE